MSTFSLVGVVIPAAAGSLFAGFMSVANLGYSFSYSTGSWLYGHGWSTPSSRRSRWRSFGVPANEQGEMSIAMLTLIGAMAYFLSFLVIQKLPTRRRRDPRRTYSWRTPRAWHGWAVRSCAG